MHVRPTFCPRADCPSRTTATAFTCHSRGTFRRRCDARVIRRFTCLACSRDFSEQTFRVNYRLKRPDLLLRFFAERISKVTHRQSARINACSRSTEERHFRRLSAHCQAFHAQRLSETAARGGVGEVFLLDELETYEHHRTEKPVTVPILIERDSGFVLDARVGALAARRVRGARRRRPSRGATDPSPARTEARKSESRKVVRAAFEVLRATAPKDRPLCVLTDMKSSYARLLRELFGKRCAHGVTSSRRRREVTNPLWPINHTLARVRDNVSRLVRETWAAAKRGHWLAGHLAIWVCYRNYVRGRTNRHALETPAMALKVQNKRWNVEQLLDRRIFSCA